VRPDLAFLLALLASGTGLDQASAQGVRNVVVTGRIVDASGRPVRFSGADLFLPGVDSVVGSQRADQSLADSLGNFTLRGPLQAGCYAIVARAIGFGITVRTFSTATGSVNLGMMTMHSGPYPEMPSFFMLECDRSSGIAPYDWGHDDTVRVTGRVDTPTPRPK
jgi:hypothetical protein